MDAIGIEVKYSIEKRNLRTIISQLNSYADSGALTKLYLAVAEENSLVKKIKVMKDIKFGLIVYHDGKVKTVLESPKLEVKYDKLAFQSPSGDKIEVYEFGKPKPVTSCSREEELKKLKHYHIIYIKLRGKTHIMDVL